MNLTRPLSHGHCKAVNGAAGAGLPITRLHSETNQHETPARQRLDRWAARLDLLLPAGRGPVRGPGAPPADADDMATQTILAGHIVGSAPSDLFSPWIRDGSN